MVSRRLDTFSGNILGRGHYHHIYLSHGGGYRTISLNNRHIHGYRIDTFGKILGSYTHSERSHVGDRIYSCLLYTSDAADE